MAFDERNARAVVRALLNLTGGLVGQFVPVAAVVGRAGPGAKQALEEVAARRWVHVRGDRVAATRWAIEFAMDWTHVPTLLRAIVNTAGGINKTADVQIVVAACGLSDDQCDMLLNELAIIGLVGDCLVESEAGRSTRGAYVTVKGWEHLQTHADCC